MGYDIRFYIVKKYNSSKNEEGRYFAEVITRYEYCKDYNLSRFCDTFEDTNCYIYDMLDEPIINDCYGDKLKEIPINAMIDYLEKHPENYWRYDIFLNMLKAFSNYIDIECNNLVILRYGH